MARRFSSKNTIFGLGTLYSAAHGLGKTPDEWSVNLRFRTSYAAGNGATNHCAGVYISGVSASNIRVRASTGGSTLVNSARGDLFCWVNHSIVK